MTTLAYKEEVNASSFKSTVITGVSVKRRVTRKVEQNKGTSNACTGLFSKEDLNVAVSNSKALLKRIASDANYTPQAIKL